MVSLLHRRFLVGFHVQFAKRMYQSGSDAFSTTKIPVSIVLQRQEQPLDVCTSPHWRVLGVVAGQEVAGTRVKRTLVRCDDTCQEYLWSGFTVELFKDGAESYYYNLVGNKPSLFVICREDEAGGLVPFLVTANHDEAGAHMEADDSVFSVSMPAEIYRWLERYVLEHYTPQQKMKRKRKDWYSDSGKDGQ